MRCTKVMLGNYSVAEELLYQILQLMAFIYKMMKMMKIKMMKTVLAISYDTPPVLIHVNGNLHKQHFSSMYIYVSMHSFS